MENKNLDSMINVLRSFGMTTEEAAASAIMIAEMIPEFTKEDIKLIQSNPNLSRLDKFKLTRKIRKIIKEQKQRESNT